jgi:hypothetical protein
LAFGSAMKPLRSATEDDVDSGENRIQLSARQLAGAFR